MYKKTHNKVQQNSESNFRLLYLNICQRCRSSDFDYIQIAIRVQKTCLFLNSGTFILIFINFCSLKYDILHFIKENSLVANLAFVNFYRDKVMFYFTSIKQRRGGGHSVFPTSSTLCSPDPAREREKSHILTQKIHIYLNHNVQSSFSLLKLCKALVFEKHNHSQTS